MGFEPCPIDPLPLPLTIRQTGFRANMASDRWSIDTIEKEIVCPGWLKRIAEKLASEGGTRK
jgi:hypothetical protein